MSKVCYLSRAARAVSVTDGYVVSIELDTNAKSKVSFLNDKTGKWIPRSFDSWRGLSGFLRNRFHREVYPESIGLVFCFDSEMNEVEKRNGASYCILPRGSGFTCFTREQTHWISIGSGTYLQCVEILHELKNTTSPTEVTVKVPEVQKKDTQNGCAKKTPGVSDYYTVRNGTVEYSSAKEALYVVRRIAGHDDWVVKSRNDNGRFVIIDSNRFVSSDDALQWLQLYIGSRSLEFTDKDGKVCDFGSATHCRRTASDGSIESYYKGGIQWLRCCIEGEVPRGCVSTDTFNFYYTFTGNDTTEECAAYRGEVARAGVLHKIYIRKDDQWVLLKAGTPEEIDAFCRSMFNVNRAESEKRKRIEARAAETEDTMGAKDTTMQEVRRLDLHRPHSRLKDVWSLIKDMTWIRAGDLMGYLWLCAARNRMAGEGPIFNTRLCDWLEQPLYVYDEEFYSSERNPECVNASKLRPFFSMQDIKPFFPDVVSLPEPIQFSDNYTDYIWDPTKPVLPLTRHTIEHICVDRINRFPRELRDYTPEQLMPIIKEAVRQGAERASRDLFYALPTYSKEHDEVSMLLPVYMPTSYSSKNKVVATLVMVSGPQGYRLATVLDTGRAVRAVGCFRDPRTTWLKECYNDEPLMD